MSMLARTALRAPRQLVVRQQVRGLHFENELGKTIPTNTDNKVWTAMKIAMFAATGFGLPFYAVHHHLKKAAAGT
ncbi:hypothetical protein BD324DRAFT_625353 [Kockovaella imperatae]|uniref:Cytochrome c oxidase subunit 8, mitochondrial n=1 Tax=Kockovaella imperatae TaxID=4999 RepID=A0A1Y1UGR7_9TREE|nr:hypothetical protein BD324DRAFT_625353 [Kockovaella imperatae]ORX37228.1 hypothetical protein BD324DRAFT_625353 [Kockovaella imperatae]